ncbi:hypothetical protein D0Z07_2268 [Hyphodiscus hymeniophilus]|uniref:Uncharacterized protein n=1 Tax=Hyphodiscus hymeniophilus TaxID=353542 RepID=A0A9P6VNG7_9HELO|nr:hypothetical protein D0Z07_2268 [Hyphodiscus hymeniophilus]
MTSPSNQPDLTTVLNADLYSKITANQLPWPRDKPLNWHSVARYMFEDELSRVNKPGGPREFWLPALQALSRIPFSELPSVDLMRHLPNPKSETFAEQAFALQVLLDQGPRILFDGETTDCRFVRGYFDVLSLRLAQGFRDLPEELRPWRRERWPGLSFEYWTLVWIWFIAPLVHSESKECHGVAQPLIEELRVDIERLSGKTDPYRKDHEVLMKDTKAFPRMIMEGTPSAKDLKMEGFWWWLLTVLDVHKPIIDHFGRYPYLNGSVGRESTAEEVEHIEETNHFGEANPEVVKRIKEDVERGVWTPLGEYKKK